ncbi:MAG: F0F1 ATP synthase subunit B [Candidatus Cloacimonetes bacterium]|jgi:F-type H+-transporting ATPase subunit b|nr:F0F1 ATP synthase subunit B [Candidatus Cloacimonadota bacterium]MBT6994875.1 F0F1 ATP synthase subunit B [Candidatus Cloacimonadota bacterium]MBT7468810.1 F0F1 ATP synthase subunit B [Candidatus Cloacimonadota bacterium]
MISINYAFIIVILNFILLLIVLNKMLYKPIKKFLAEREQKIASDIDDASGNKVKSEKLVEQKHEELKQSAEDIRKMKQLAKRDADKQASEIVDNAHTQEKKILKDTEDQLAHERDKVMKEIEGDLSELVTELSAKFLSEKIDVENDKKMISKIISDDKNEE